MKKQFSAVITQEGNLFVSLSPELDIASQGPSIEKAVTNLKEAIELYLVDEDADMTLGRHEASPHSR